MRGQTHAHPSRSGALALAGVVLAALLPGAVAAAEEMDVGDLPSCGGGARQTTQDVATQPWQVLLDEDGAVRAHRLVMRSGRADQAVVRAGRRSFALPVDGGRMLVAERGHDSTRLAMLDSARACRLWIRQVEGLAYPGADDSDGRWLRLSTHDPTTRRYTGTLLVDAETGTSGGLIDGECIEACEPNDGDVSAAALLPAGAARPVPNFARGGWPKDKTLRFRWRSGAAPPSWARQPLRSAAGDASGTSYARSPRFTYSSTAGNAVAYGGRLPAFCGINGIACAARNMPSFWGVWLRPYGTDYAWGTLRWCQKTASPSGCFDIRRVMLHELGHIAGLNHPSSAGFTLAGGDSVMQAITPMRPRTGAGRHAFGRCDVATLQEIYDTPNNKTAVSTCNDVVTTLKLSASKTAVDKGQSVKLNAWLKVDDRSAYRQLRGNPLNGRSIRLKYRRAGSDNAWKVAWMKSMYQQGRYELTITPGATWEFKAAFPVPADEGLRYSRSKVVKVKVRS